MDFQPLQLTEEDILNGHRYFITSLYLEQKKSVAEIVELLYEEYKFPVTLSQIRKCIRDWQLELPISVELQPIESETLSDDSWEIVPSMTTPSVSTNKSYTPSNRSIMSLYTKRPLPSLPTFKSSPKMDSKSRVRKRQPTTTDRVKAICHHGAGTSDSHEVETTLTSVPDGPSQIDLYVDDDQDHERVAQGLESMSFARSGQRKEGVARRHLAIKMGRPAHALGKERRDRGKGKESMESNERSERT